MFVERLEGVFGVDWDVCGVVRARVCRLDLFPDFEGAVEDLFAEAEDGRLFVLPGGVDADAIGDACFECSLVKGNLDPWSKLCPDCVEVLAGGDFGPGWRGSVGVFLSGDASVRKTRVGGFGDGGQGRLERMGSRTGGFGGWEAWTNGFGGGREDSGLVGSQAAEEAGEGGVLGRARNGRLTRCTR